MGQYYAEIQGNRGAASRMGSKESGIYGHIRGWNIGGKVNVDFDENLKTDVVKLYLTGGSNGRTGDQRILTAWHDKDGELHIELAAERQEDEDCPAHWTGNYPAIIPPCGCTCLDCVERHQEA